MDETLVQNAIRDPSSVYASDIMGDITPDILKNSMPRILQRMDAGESSEQLAESTIDGIFDTVEATVLGDSFNFVYERFGDRIFDMIINGAFLKIFEKVSLLFT